MNLGVKRYVLMAFQNFLCHFRWFDPQDKERKFGDIAQTIGNVGTFLPMLLVGSMRDIHFNNYKITLPSNWKNWIISKSIIEEHVDADKNSYTIIEIKTSKTVKVVMITTYLLLGVFLPKVAALFLAISILGIVCKMLSTMHIAKSRTYHTLKTYHKEEPTIEDIRSNSNTICGLPRELSPSFFEAALPNCTWTCERVVVADMESGQSYYIGRDDFKAVVIKHQDGDSSVFVLKGNENLCSNSEEAMVKCIPYDRTIVLADALADDADDYTIVNMETPLPNPSDVDIFALYYISKFSKDCYRRSAEDFSFSEGDTLKKPYTLYIQKAKEFADSIPTESTAEQVDSPLVWADICNEVHTNTTNESNQRQIATKIRTLVTGGMVERKGNALPKNNAVFDFAQELLKSDADFNQVKEMYSYFDKDPGLVKDLTYIVAISEPFYMEKMRLDSTSLAKFGFQQIPKLVRSLPSFVR